MPYAINGVGTQFYGHAEPLPSTGKRHLLSWLLDRDDQHESWIVTEWITFFWIPLVPLRSLRVWPVDYSYSWIGNQSRTDYRVRKLSLYWPQVVWGYSITFAVFALPWILDERNAPSFRDNAGLLLPLGIIAAVLCAGLIAFITRGGRNQDGLTTTTTLNPFTWPARQRVAGFMSVALGALIGGAAGYVLTGRGDNFIRWVVDQPYYEWPILGWGLLGGVIGAGLFFIANSLSPHTQQSDKTLGAHPQSGRNVSVISVGNETLVSDGEVSVPVPTNIPIDDVTLGLATKLLQTRTRSATTLRENEVDVRFVRRWGSATSEIKLLFSQVYSLSELRYCRDQFIKGIRLQSSDWNVAVRSLLEWAKKPNDNMWYSVDLSLAAIALRAFPAISGRCRCIVWFDQSGGVTATLIKPDSTAMTVGLGVLPVRSAT
jgi:hypothetical protein